MQAVEDTLGGCDQSADLSSAVDLITEGARAFKVSKPVFARPEYAHLLPIIDHLVAASASLGQAARDSSQGQVDKMRASVSKVRDAALNRLLANMRQIEFVEGHNGKDKKAWRSCNIAVLTCICEREQALAVVDERMDE